jgi:hypothetical protein
MPACPPNGMRIRCGAIMPAPAQTYVPQLGQGARRLGGTPHPTGPSAACAVRRQPQDPRTAEFASLLESQSLRSYSQRRSMVVGPERCSSGRRTSNPQCKHWQVRQSRRRRVIWNGLWQRGHSTSHTIRPVTIVALSHTTPKNHAPEGTMSVARMAAAKPPQEATKERLRRARIRFAPARSSS